VTWVAPEQDLAEVGAWGLRQLEALIAIDSQSDEESDTIPSTEGQRELAEHVRGVLEPFGWSSELDEHANLIITIPANPAPGGEAGPPLVLMTHLDTSRGTQAVTALERAPGWDGGPIPFPANARLEVTSERYATTRCFVGEDVVHGPGERPVGLDNKLGLAEVLTLAWLLSTNDVPHPELLLVFRPDEEIGRMAAVEGLAALVAGRGVRHGYTVDGFLPFEINTENFDAARARLRFEGGALHGTQAANRCLTLRFQGAKSHGATAKAEGYRNTTVMLARALAPWADDDAVVVLRFATDPTQETDAEVEVWLRASDGDDLERLERALLEAVEREVGPHRWKGATFEVGEREDMPPHQDLRGQAPFREALRFVRALLESDGPRPLLSEESEGYEGYTNPYAITPAGGSEGGYGAALLQCRIREFGEEKLAAREAHIRRLAETWPTVASCDLERQYVNMGAALAAHPELVAWAREAARAMGAEPAVGPIRGGTGVDPFIAHGTMIANVGTGYFAPESEKELTSVQAIARHAVWLFHLVQAVARG
jgi:tripeptide aminopeptidase